MSAHEVNNYIPALDEYDCTCGEKFRTGRDLAKHVSSNPEDRLAVRIREESEKAFDAGYLLANYECTGGPDPGYALFEEWWEKRHE
jgi:hypothetical protein